MFIQLLHEQMGLGLEFFEDRLPAEQLTEDRGQISRLQQMDPLLDQPLPQPFFHVKRNAVQAVDLPGSIIGSDTVDGDPGTGGTAVNEHELAAGAGG